MNMKEIKKIAISKLTLLENNPRKISSEQMQLLVKSLEDDPDFFNSRPCLVNQKDGKLIVYAGNQRVRAAKKLKWKEVPCIVDEDLSEARMKDRVVKDNKTFGEFDFDILANEFDIDQLVNAGFSLEELHLEVPGGEDSSGEQGCSDDKCDLCGNKIKSKKKK